MLRKREENPFPNNLSDIFGYIDNQGSNSFAITPNQIPGGEQGWGSTGYGLNYSDPQANNGADGNVAQDPLTFNPRDAYRGIVNYVPNSPSGEGSGGGHFSVDDSKLPNTPFGSVLGVGPVGPHSTLYNPDLVIDDPNYGRISPASNFKPDQVNTIAQQALMSAALAGFGGLLGPNMGWVTQLINGARSLGSGADPLHTLLSIVSSYLPGAAGLDGLTGSLASTGINAALNGGRINPITLAMMLARAGINAAGKP